MDKELEELELLSLVNKVSQEIFNFTGSADQDLAKFVIAVSASFQARLFSFRWGKY
jgi:ATP-dependent RNA helicase DHX8/PRP22